MSLMGSCLCFQNWCLIPLCYMNYLPYLAEQILKIAKKLTRVPLLHSSYLGTYEILPNEEELDFSRLSEPVSFFFTKSFSWKDIYLNSCNCLSNPNSTWHFNERIVSRIQSFCLAGMDLDSWLCSSVPCLLFQPSQRTRQDGDSSAQGKSLLELSIHRRPKF